MTKKTLPTTKAKPKAKASAKQAKTSASTRKAQGKTAAAKQESKQSRPLTAQQQLFVDEYIIDLNGTQAAIRAGYAESSARATASRLLTIDNIQDAIAEARKEQQKRTQITADRVLLEVARLAMYDPRKFFNDSGDLLSIHDLDDDTAAALAGMDVMELPDGAGSIKKIKLVDKGPNLERLMKHLGLYERDNEQKTDPLAALLHGIANSNAGAFMPVADDPELKGEVAGSSLAVSDADEDH